MTRPAPRPLSGARLLEIFRETSESCDCTVKALHAVAAAVLRHATPDGLIDLATVYQDRADHGVGWRDWYAERLAEDGA